MRLIIVAALVAAAFIAGHDFGHEKGYRTALMDLKNIPLSRLDLK